jgi:DeoR family transcriptional regulator, fructose operon transcriptional repressor
MQPEERRHRLVEYLQKVEFASLDELANAVGASASTVRRDLTLMEGTGAARRTHGGARAVNPKSEEFVFSSRDTHQVSEKEAIGQAAAALIAPNQSVIIDTGTTCYHVARHLADKHPQIITNSLPVANLFASAAMVEVVLSGGVVYPRLGALLGPLAAETFSRMNADVAIMSGSGLTLESISNSHALLIEIQKAMMEAAEKIIFCLDHTKLGRKSMSHLCVPTADLIDTVVTDAGAPVEIIQALRQRDIEVIVAPAAA